MAQIGQMRVNPGTLPKSVGLEIPLSPGFAHLIEGTPGAAEWREPA